MARRKTGNVGIIGDTHIPFEKKGYLEFCKRTFDYFECDEIVHIGDLVDLHALSYHERDPNGRSAKDELDIAKERLRLWYKAFPRIQVS